MRTAICTGLLAAALLASCGGSTGSDGDPGGSGGSSTNSVSSGAIQTSSQMTTPTEGQASISTAHPKHSKGGPRSAHLPSSGAPDNAISGKTTPGN